MGHEEAPRPSVLPASLQRILRWNARGCWLWVWSFLRGRVLALHERKTGHSGVERIEMRALLGLTPPICGRIL